MRFYFIAKACSIYVPTRSITEVVRVSEFYDNLENAYKSWKKYENDPKDLYYLASTSRPHIFASKIGKYGSVKKVEELSKDCFIVLEISTLDEELLGTHIEGLYDSRYYNENNEPENISENDGPIEEKEIQVDNAFAVLKKD